MLRMIGGGRQYADAPIKREAIIAAVIRWIDEREHEILDVEHGACHILLQAAQEIGARRRLLRGR